MRKIILPIIVICLFFPVFKTWAIDIVDGDLIRASNSADVYIVKIIPSTSSGQPKQFKRLILNPEIFNQYGHLKWENIKTVSQEEIDEYIISDLVRAVGDDKVYKLYPSGDTGEKRWIKTAEDFLAFNYDWDAIYAINNFERDFYVTGQELVINVPTTPNTPTVPTTPMQPVRNPININVPADYQTIQAAINNAINGDTVSVQNGIYKENLIIDKKINLIGEFSGSTIIDGGGTGNALTITNGDGVLIQRFTIQSENNDAIYCSGENTISATFKNLIINDSAWGIVAEKNCRLTILNNLIYNNRNSTNTDGAGILINDTFSYGFISEIINNTIDDNYHGIWSENADLKVMNNIITSNIGSLGTNINTGIYHIGNGKTDNSYNDVYSNGQEYGGDAVPGNGSINAFPNYVYPGQRDYRLKTGSAIYSPCLDAGNPDYIYNDINYTSNTARNDMGAYGGPDNIGWTP